MLQRKRNEKIMYNLFRNDKKLSGYSTFGIGGPARYFIEVKEIEVLQQVIAFCHREKIPFLIIGKGSNCLFPDEGFDGLVILNKIDFYKEDTKANVYVGAGFSFALLGMQTAKKNFSGLEFAAGIPGSVGGAIFMNAGANESDTSKVLDAVDFIDEKGVLHHLKKENLSFSYRASSFQQMPGAIVAGYFSLSVNNDSARPKQLALLNKRIETQPYSDKSVGCVFRNPPGSSAGSLIDSSGLKGTSIGGATVSIVHANFIVNKGGATAGDVLALIDLVRSEVAKTHGIELEPEIRIIPHKRS